LHNYYLNIENSDKEKNNISKSFKLDIDINENFSSICKAFMKKIYNQKEILSNKESNYRYNRFSKLSSNNNNLLNKYDKEKDYENKSKLNENQKNVTFYKENEIERKKDIGNEYFEYFFDKDESKEKKTNLDNEKYITFDESEKEITKKLGPKGNKLKIFEEKFNFNKNSKKLYSELYTEDAIKDSDNNNYFLNNLHSNKLNDLEEFFSNKDFNFELNKDINSISRSFFRKDSQISNATSEKIYLNVGNDDGESIHINSNENSNNFLFKSLSDKLEKNIYELKNNKNKMDLEEENLGNSINNNYEKSHSELLDFKKNSNNESLFVKKTTNENEKQLDNPRKNEMNKTISDRNISVDGKINNSYFLQYIVIMKIYIFFI